jgi:hypothetical protein
MRDLWDDVGSSRRIAIITILLSYQGILELVPARAGPVFAPPA